MTQQDDSAGQRQQGNTLLGFVIGLVVGLAIAVAVAVYIANAPLPFVTKVRPPSTTLNAPTDGKAPDPNKAFSVGTPPPSPSASAAAPAAPVQSAAPSTAPAEAAATETAPPKEEPLPEGSRFLLQAGAFKSPAEADSMRAQLAMMGLDSRVFPIEQGGETLYRVRLGPYGQIDDVNRVRKLLAENSIEAQVVRLR
jgi:cell division protein FtsN